MSRAIQKYYDRVKKVNSRLCVGPDANVQKIPEHFHKEKYPQFAFNKWIIEETHEYVAAFKPNFAFYPFPCAGGDQNPADAGTDAAPVPPLRHVSRNRLPLPELD